MSKEMLDGLDAQIEEMERAMTNHSSDKDESSITDEPELDTTEPEVSADDNEPTEPDGDEKAGDINPDEDVLGNDPGTEPQEPDLTDTEPEERKKPRENWKKRYTTYKGKTDGTIHTLRVEIATLTSQYSTVLEQVEILKTALAESKVQKQDKPIDELFTKEERDVLGDEALLAMKRVTDDRIKDATEPLQAELAEAAEQRRKDIKGRAEDAAALAQSNFRTMLSNAVPNLDEIDIDPKFGEWLGESDAHGLTRMQLLKNAQIAGDVDRVAQFFLEFSGKSAKKNDQLEAHISPEGKGSATPASKDQPRSKKRWTRESIDKFYADELRGVYKGKEKLQKQLEDSIDAAVTEAMRTGVGIPAR